jgi:hypothetical protein
VRGVFLIEHLVIGIYLEFGIWLLEFKKLILLIQIPIIRLISDLDSISVLHEVGLFLSFVKVAQEGLQERSVTSPKIDLIPFEDHGDENRPSLRRDFHLGAVDEALGSKLKLEIDLFSLVKADRWA